MSAVIYVRVSDERQTDGTSLETQQELCEAWCAARSIPVARVFIEAGASAKTANRPQFQAALKYAVASRSDYFLVYKYNRFARNQNDHAMSAALLRSKGVQLVSVTEGIDANNAAGRAMEGMFAVFNEFENAIRSENSTNGMKKRASNGRWVWFAPLGYKNGLGSGPSLVHDELRAPLVQKLFELIGTGRFTDADAARHVVSLGLRSKTGGGIGPETLRGLLTNPLYYGRVVLPKWGIDVQGDFTPIIDKALFDRVQAIRAGRAPRAVPRKRNNRLFPLRGTVKCTLCSGTITAGSSKGKKKVLYHYYRCTKPGHINVRAEQVEQDFLRVLDSLRPIEERLELAERVFRDVWTERRKTADADSDALKTRLRKLELQKTRVLESMAEGRLTGDDFSRVYDKLQAQIADVESELEIARAGELHIEEALGYLGYVLRNLSALWMDKDLDGKQRLQQIIFPNGLIWAQTGHFEPPESDVNDSFYRVLSDSSLGDDDLVGPEGFEPPTKGL